MPWFAVNYFIEADMNTVVYNLRICLGLLLTTSLRLTDTLIGTNTLFHNTFPEKV